MLYISKRYPNQSGTTMSFFVRSFFSRGLHVRSRKTARCIKLCSYRIREKVRSRGLKEKRDEVRADSGGSISRTSGLERLRETRNFGARAKVRVVRARGGTNGMVFTNANKHSYQLQNDSPTAGTQSAYRPSARTRTPRRRDIVPSSPAPSASSIPNF